MRILGIRDIIGPIMIGPSSSHTAGALRIASMCRRLLAGEPRQVAFHLYGSFAHTYRGHGTDKALVAGLLGMAADEQDRRSEADQDGGRKEKAQRRKRTRLHRPALPARLLIVERAAIVGNAHGLGAPPLTCRSRPCRPGC